MADRELQIPKRVQESAKKLLILAPDRPLEEDQHVDIRVEREVAASVAAEGADGDRLCRGRCLEKQPLQERIDAIGVALGRQTTGRPARGFFNQLLPRRFQHGRRTYRRLTVGGVHGSGQRLEHTAERVRDGRRTTPPRCVSE